MKRTGPNDTQPGTPDVDRTDPGAVPVFGSNDPPAAPTEQEVRDAERMVAKFHATVRQRSLRYVERASSDGGDAVTYGGVTTPSRAQLQEADRRRGVVLGQLAHLAREAAARGPEDPEAESPPGQSFVTRKTRRTARRWWMTTLLGTAIAGGVIALVAIVVPRGPAARDEAAQGRAASIPVVAPSAPAAVGPSASANVPAPVAQPSAAAGTAVPAAPSTAFATPPMNVHHVTPAASAAPPLRTAPATSASSRIRPIDESL